MPGLRWLTESTRTWCIGGYVRDASDWNWQNFKGALRHSCLCNYRKFQWRSQVRCHVLCRPSTQAMVGKASALRFNAQFSYDRVAANNLFVLSYGGNRG